jgi:hypothetical protein
MEEACIGAFPRSITCWILDIPAVNMITRRIDRGKAWLPDQQWKPWMPLQDG